MAKCRHIICSKLVFNLVLYGTSNGILTGQKTNKPDELFEFFHSLYADYVAIMFASREDIINGTSLCHTYFQRF